MKIRKKRYIGEFLMPPDIEAALHALCEAVKRNGYDYSSNATCHGQLTSFFLSRWDTQTDIFTEITDGKWMRYEWIDDDDETQAQA